MPTWPPNLPDRPDASGYSEKPTSQVVRSSMEAGPAKVRRRFTAAPTDMTLRYDLLSREGVDTFEAFFNNDLAGGALAFDFPHPRHGTAVSVRIVGDPPYELTPRGSGRFWTLALKVEVLP
tara:strand:- start:36821 stop:37183 length:363 start_codon:yes stop_codon:yes gene_type:complete